MAMHFIKNTIQEKAKFNIYELEPLKHVVNTFTPAFFIHAKKDKIIPVYHSMKLYDKYAGDKKLRVIEGTHNSYRSTDVRREVAQFFYKALRVEIVLLV